MFSENRQKNKLEILGKLTASLAHEMRNPLSAIKLNLEYMKMSSSDIQPEMNDSLDDCLQGVGMIESLIESILSFSRKSKDEIELVSINSLTQKAIDLSLPKAQKKRVKINFELTSVVPVIQFNQSNLLQVFLNLIGNSIEACKEKTGLISIKTYMDDNSTEQRVMWQITDNGIGMKEEIQDEIFKEFFTNKDSGTGLGLSVSKSLLEENNAKLNFSSTYGEGTTFTIGFIQGTRGEDVK